MVRGLLLIFSVLCTNLVLAEGPVNRSAATSNIIIGGGSHVGGIVIDGEGIDGTKRASIEHGYGKIVTQERRVPSFSGVRINISAVVEIVAGKKTGLSIKAHENLVSLIESEGVGQTLTLRATQPYSTTVPIAIIIAAPQINAVSLRGAASIEVRGLTGQKLALLIEGSGRLAAQGEVDTLRARINGSGTLALQALKVVTGHVDIRGSGVSTIHASETLYAEVLGSGHVRYKGSPRVLQAVRGSGRIISQAR